MQISTFHSFGLRLIRENTKYLDLGNNFAIYDTEDSLTLVKKILKSLNIDTNKFTPKSFRNKISSLKNDLINYQEYKQYAKTDFDEMTVKVYQKYEEDKVKLEEYKLSLGTDVEAKELLTLFGMPFAN